MKKIEMADWKVTRAQKRMIKEVLKSGRLTYGPFTRALETKFAGLHNRKYALFTNSGTAALKIALGALKEKHGWKDGDEVLIPSVTFVATMNAVVMNNLTPVLVDVSLSDVNMDPDQIEKRITKRTRCIIPVHLLGQPADMPRIMEIAHKHNLKVVEDSCETMFVRRHGHVVGSMGDVACFSSYIAHLMVTGVGGFMLTNDKDLATDMRSMMFHGRDESYLNIDDNNKTGKARDEMIARRFWFPRFGYSDRLTELEAALGLGDLDNWGDMIADRQRNAEYLWDRLENYLTIPVENSKNHAFMFFPAFADKRDELMMHLEKSGIHTRTMMPLTTQPVVKKYVKKYGYKEYPKADWINKHGILLPVHQYLTTDDLDYIIACVKEFYEGAN